MIPSLLPPSTNQQGAHLGPAAAPDLLTWNHTPKLVTSQCSPTIQAPPLAGASHQGDGEGGGLFPFFLWSIPFVGEHHLSGGNWGALGSCPCPTWGGDLWVFIYWGH